MQKYTLSLLSAVIGVGISVAPLEALQASTARLDPASVEQLAALTGGTIRTYGGTRLRYYPNHVIVADYYDKQVIRNILALSRELGWDTVYVQVPYDLRDYTSQYFIDNNLSVTYFAVGVNPDRWVGGYGYHGYHGYHRDHHRHDHHGAYHHGGHKEHHGHKGQHGGGHHKGNHGGGHHKAHHGGGHHGGGHHGGGHHGGGHHGGGHHGGGHHGGGHHGGHR